MVFGACVHWSLVPVSIEVWCLCPLKFGACDHWSFWPLTITTGSNGLYNCHLCHITRGHQKFVPCYVQNSAGNTNKISMRICRVGLTPFPFNLRPFNFYIDAEIYAICFIFAKLHDVVWDRNVIFISLHRCEHFDIQ